MLGAVVLFSGGVDSTVAVAKAVADGYHQIATLNVAYGSLHNVAERRAAQQLRKEFKLVWWRGISWVHVDIDLPESIFKGGKSSLMGEGDIPDAQYQDFGTEGPSSTVVPFRNAVLISIATAFAEKEEYDAVYMAMHANDAAHWAYPDCTPEFVGAMANAVYVGTMCKIRLVTPFVWMTKTDVVGLGYELNAPLELTWSCYRGGDFHCGTCPTCIERHRAFIDAVGYDPTKYEENVHG